MIGYLIDPFELQVTQVTLGNDYKEIYGFIRCEIFTTVEVNKFGDTIFVDDEGLYVANQLFFIHTGYPYQPLAGRGLLLGCNLETGESQSPVVSLEQTIKQVSFLTPYQVRLWLNDHPDA